MAENIDNLLDDLDALITNKPSSANSNSVGTLPYRVPHRPPNEKSPTQLNNPNPKNRFAVNPSANYSYNSQQQMQSQQQSQQQYQGFRSQNTRQQSETSNNNKDDIDSILELLDDSPMQRQPPSSSSSFVNSNINSTSTKLPSSTLGTSQYAPSSRGSSSSTSPFPSFDGSTSSSSQKHHTTSNYSSGLSDVNGFDSLLSDLNNSLPPVSPPKSTAESSVTRHSSSSSSSASLLQPPPQATAGAGKGASRCSKVVVAGSAMSRGAKTSAFSKSACDRLRCLKCNFEAIQFSGYAWSSNVDYMFFRNNMPNRQKLTPQLETRPSSVAYCCQCSWLSSEEEETLTGAGQSNKPQWVCAGH